MERISIVVNETGDNQEDMNTEVEVETVKGKVFLSRPEEKETPEQFAERFLKALLGEEHEIVKKLEKQKNTTQEEVTNSHISNSSSIPDQSNFGDGEVSSQTKANTESLSSYDKEVLKMYGDGDHVFVMVVFSRPDRQMIIKYGEGDPENIYAYWGWIANPEELLFLPSEELERNPSALESLKSNATHKHENHRRQTQTTTTIADAPLNSGDYFMGCFVEKFLYNSMFYSHLHRFNNWIEAQLFLENQLGNEPRSSSNFFGERIW